MDIDRTRYFHVFSETGSLVRASDVLRISQPALSKAIRLLEREVGAKLVEPEGRGLRLTEAGRTFKEVTGPLLAQWQGVPDVIKNQARAPVVRLASFEVFTTYFLGSFLRTSAVPNLEVHELIPGAMETAIAEGRADVGITYLPIPKAGVDFVEAARIRMGLFGVKAFEKVPFARLPFAVPLQPLQGAPSKVRGLDGWPEHRLPRNVSYKVTMMETALELCRQGLAVAYLPTFIARLHNESVKSQCRLVELECPVPKVQRQQSVFFICRSGSSEPQFMRAIAKALRSLD